MNNFYHVIEVNAFGLARMMSWLFCVYFWLRKCAMQKRLHDCLFEAYEHLTRFLTWGILRSIILHHLFIIMRLLQLDLQHHILFWMRSFLLVRHSSKCTHWVCLPNVLAWISYKLQSAILVLILDNTTAMLFLAHWSKLKVNKWSTLRRNSETIDIWGGYQIALYEHLYMRTWVLISTD